MTRSLTARGWLACALTALLAVAPSARAADRLTLDPRPASPGHVLDSPPGSPPGSVLVAWTSAAPRDGLAPVPKVCVIPPGGTCSAPQILHAPEGDGEDAAITGLFPIVAGDGVTLVGPRDDKTDVLTWHSSGGGAFGSATRVSAASPNLTTPEDVLPSGLLGAVNNGLGIGAFGAARGEFTFAHPGADVVSSSLALDGAGRPVDAYFTLDNRVHVYRYSGTGAMTDSTNWTGPVDVAQGDEPVLSGGAAGLFLADVEGTRLVLRSDDGGAFGAPRVLADDPGTELFDAGATAQSPNGRLVVLWPQTRSADGAKVMRAFASTDHGATFSASDVATLGDSYLEHRNASAAVGDDGQGAVAFEDADGLHLADLTPLAPVQNPGTPPVVVTPPPVTTRPAPVLVFDPSRGPFNLTGLTVGRTALTLATPRGCVRDGRIVMQLSAHSRQGHARVRIRNVQFRLDGRVLRTRTRAPFSLRVRVNVAPGTRHVLSARVLLSNQRARTLRNRFSACSA